MPCVVLYVMVVEFFQVCYPRCRIVASASCYWSSLLVAAFGVVEMLKDCIFTLADYAAGHISQGNAWQQEV
jgi:hypothetical protein